MNRWNLFWKLDWPRFLYLFFFVDVAMVVIAVWASAHRMAGAVMESHGLEQLRQLSLDAQQQLQDLVDDASA